MSLHRRVLAYVAGAALASCALTVLVGTALVRHQISTQRVTAEPLTDGLLELEGEQLRAIELGHTDTDGTSALHVPCTGLVVAGDAVYGDVNLYLAARCPPVSIFWRQTGPYGAGEVSR